MNLEHIRTVASTLGKQYGPFALRLGMAGVFLYFGISQLRNPEAFIGWLPPEASILPIEPRTLILLNGAFETFFASLLTLGIWTRLSAFLLGMHLAGITFTIGFTEVGVRDAGLTVAALALAAMGCEEWSLDEYFGEPEEKPTVDNYTQNR